MVWWRKLKVVTQYEKIVVPYGLIYFGLHDYVLFCDFSCLNYNTKRRAKARWLSIMVIQWWFMQNFTLSPGIYAMLRLISSYSAWRTQMIRLWIRSEPAKHCTVKACWVTLALISKLFVIKLEIITDFGYLR